MLPKGQLSVPRPFSSHAHRIVYEAATSVSTRDRDAVPPDNSHESASLDRQLWHSRLLHSSDPLLSDTQPLVLSKLVPPSEAAPPSTTTQTYKGILISDPAELPVLKFAFPLPRAVDVDASSHSEFFRVCADKEDFLVLKPDLEISVHWHVDTSFSHDLCTLTFIAFL